MENILIKEAELRYPVGTTFYVFSYKKTKKTCISNGRFKESTLGSDKICMDDEKGTYVYQHGIWAGVVKLKED